MPFEGSGEIAMSTYGYSTSGSQEAMLKEQYSRSNTWRIHRTHRQYRHALKTCYNKAIISPRQSIPRQIAPTSNKNRYLTGLVSHVYHTNISQATYSSER